MAEARVTFDNAQAYEDFMGRWSRAIGEKFLAWLAPPKNARWLDLGCGTGAFTGLILKTCMPAKVTGVDPSPQQVEHAKTHFPNAEFRVGDSMALPFGDGEFDVVASALVLHFIPDRHKAFAEMVRVVKPGGIVAGYTWERSETVVSAPYWPLKRGITEIGAQPALSPLVPEAMPDGVRATAQAAGLTDIDTKVIEASQIFRDFEDYWSTQASTFHPIGKLVAAMSEAERERLRALMRKILPAKADGAITYSARATAFKARRPR